MIQEIKALFQWLKTDPLPTICGLLIAAVVYLWLDLKDTRKTLDGKEERFRLESVDRELKCAEKVNDAIAFYQVRLDSFAAREIRKADAQVRELNSIIATLKRRK